MSIVRFATLCDICQKRSEEYTRWYTCRDCQKDVCDEHILHGSEDSEGGTAICKQCIAPAAFTPEEVEKIAADTEAEDRAEAQTVREYTDAEIQEMF